MKPRISLWLMAAMFLATVSFAEAQQPGKIFRIGFLSNTSPSAITARTDAFRQGLRELGVVATSICQVSSNEKMSG
jgi:aspartate aminotransferase-like enzyme